MVHLSPSLVVTAAWLLLGAIIVTEAGGLKHMRAHGKHSDDRDPHKVKRHQHPGLALPCTHPTVRIPELVSAPVVGSSHSPLACPVDMVEIVEARYAEITAAPLKFGSIDIIKHLPVLRKFASNVTSVTELGVRNGIASWAIAAGIADRLASGQAFEAYTAVDITRAAPIDCMEEVLKRCSNMAYSFVEGDDLKLEPFRAELTFIDTWHTYAQLAKELQRWGAHTIRFLVS